MAIAIKEYLGYEGIQIEWDYKPNTALNASEAVNLNTISEDSLMVDIEGIHVGQTRNFTYYTQEALEGSIPTWTKPYQRPLIMHHNEKDGKIIGRLKFVTYTDKNTLSNTGALIFTAYVPDKEGKEQIQDGRLKTTSIGVIVHDARCSICGTNIAEEGPCDHERGQKYDGKVCYWVIYAMEAKELSYVIVPSDIYAQNIKIYKPTKAELNMAANYENKGVLDLSEATNINDPKLNQTEGTIIDENGEKDVGNTPVPSDDVELLKKEIDDLKAKIKLLDDENGNLKSTIETETKVKDEAVKDLGDTKVLLDQAQKSLKTIQDALTVKESEIVQEKTLRESVENEVINLKSIVKDGLIENAMILRQSLNKPVIAKEELEKRSEDSLKDAIRDMKEELDNPKVVTNITPATNPSLVENLDENNKDVKEAKKTGNIDLVEGLESIFSTIVGSKN